MTIMRKFIYFSLWEIEHIEHILEQMEKEGYRLINVRYSYLFEFKNSKTKEMNYSRFRKIRVYIRKNRAFLYSESNVKCKSLCLKKEPKWYKHKQNAK